MAADINEKLAQFLKGQNWEKKSTNIQGVFLLKLPTFKNNRICTPTFDWKTSNLY
jgi:hypothetical protein